MRTPRHFHGRHHPLAWLLWPLSLLFSAVVTWREWVHRRGQQRHSPVVRHDTRCPEVPVIVVGNITVGGVGKTPLVQAVVARLSSLGWRPGIVSRGYGGQRQLQPMMVQPDSDPFVCGDEPVLHARLTGMPVCVCVDRPAAVAHLVRQADVNVAVSDDGLQHLALRRDLEIAVLDGRFGLGNGWLLPAGPLREPARRLRRVDLIAVQQDPESHSGSDSVPAQTCMPPRVPSGTFDTVPHGSFHLAPRGLRCLGTGQVFPLSWLQGRGVHALAALGNPQRFFDTLAGLGAQMTEHARPDHDAYVDGLPIEDDGLPVIVTGKDAVKLQQRCTEKQRARVFELQVFVVLDAALQEAMDRLLKSLALPSEARFS